MRRAAVSTNSGENIDAAPRLGNRFDAVTVITENSSRRAADFRGEFCGEFGEQVLDARGQLRQPTGDNIEHGSLKLYKWPQWKLWG